MVAILTRPRHAGDLLRELVARDVKLRYRRSVLGIAWSQLAPLSMIAVFSFVFTRVVPLSIPNYPAFLFVGLLAWIWFQSSILGATVSVVDGRDLVRQPGFPMSLIPVVALTSSFINYLLALPVLFIWIGATTGRIPGSAIALPAIIITQFLITLGPAYLLAALHVTFRDVSHIVEILLLPLFYATPIFYNASRIPRRFHLVYDLNPLAHLMNAYRNSVLLGHWPDGLALLVLTLVGILMILVGHHIFTARASRFAEEL